MAETKKQVCTFLGWPLPATEGENGEPPGLARSNAPGKNEPIKSTTADCMTPLVKQEFDFDTNSKTDSNIHITEAGKGLVSDDAISKLANPLDNTTLPALHQERSKEASVMPTTYTTFPPPNTPDIDSIRRGPYIHHGRIISTNSSNTRSTLRHKQGGNKNTNKHNFLSRPLALVLPHENKHQGGDRQTYKVAIVLAATNLGAVCSVVASMGVLINSQKGDKPATTGVIVWLVVSIVALTCSSTTQSVLQLYGRKNAVRPDEEWIELAHRQRFLPPIKRNRYLPEEPKADGRPEDFHAQDEAWDKFVGNPSRLRNYVEDLEEQLSIANNMTAASARARNQGPTLANSAKGKAKEEYPPAANKNASPYQDWNEQPPQALAGRSNELFPRPPTPFMFLGPAPRDVLATDVPYDTATRAQYPASGGSRLDELCAAETKPYSPLSDPCVAGPSGTLRSANMGQSRAITPAANVSCSNEAGDSGFISAPTQGSVTTKETSQQKYLLPPGRRLTHQRMSSLDIINGKAEGF